MEFIKSFFKRIYSLMIKFPLATAAAIFIVIAAVVMKFLGHDVQIGGLLDKLFGRKPSQDIRVIPPINRIDLHGNLIPLGESDNEGYIQPPVSVEIKPSGIFSNPDTITIIKPDKTEVVLPLPTGITNKNVSEVMEIKPSVYQIKNNDNGVNTSELENILK